MQVIINGKVYIKDKFIETDLVIEEGKIVKIEKININNYSNYKIIDAKNKIISPSFTDVHVHFREPGQEHKETIESGIESAINGGYTSVIMMPNTSPVIDNQKVIDYLTQKTFNKPIDIWAYTSVTIGQKGKELTPIESLTKNNIIKGFSDDGYGISKDNIMESALKISSNNQILIAAHLQDDKYCSHSYVINQGLKSKELDLPGSSNEVEWKQAQRDIKLLKKYPNAKYHMCHISTKETIALVKKAKLEGMILSCEVTPHHLIISDEDIPDDNANWKMNPPLRGAEDKEALIEALNNGTIEIIATDHAPHSLDEKQQGFKKAPFGIIGLDFAFSSLYTYLVKTKKVKLETIIKAMSTNPNRIFNLPNSEIIIDNDANILIIDLEKKFIVNKDFIKSKSKNTPLLGKELQGYITHVFYKGKNLKEIENE